MTAMHVKAGIPVKPRILIVDDEAAIRDLLQMILGDKYECKIADSAENALTILESEHFDVVISDQNMGAMSGIALTSHIIAASPDTVVMLASGDQTMDTPIEAIRSGAFDYIKKPFNIDQVEIAVERAAKNSELRVSKRRQEDQLKELITKRTAELNYLAHNDSLTGLRNRPFFEDQLALTLRLQKDKKKVAVIVVSLDRFKTLRDTLGHSGGDLLLKEAASRLTKAINKSATVARFEGDEFAALIDAETTDELVALADGIFHAFRTAVVVADEEMVVSVSLGISFAPNDGIDAQSLLKNASIAL